jgi:hypothetical protein
MCFFRSGGYVTCSPKYSLFITLYCAVAFELGGRSREQTFSEFTAYDEERNWIETSICKQQVFGQVKGVDHDGMTPVQAHPTG